MKQIKELYQASVIQRNKPKLLAEEDNRLFEHEYSKSLPAVQLLDLKDCNANNDALLFKNFKVLPLSFRFGYAGPYKHPYHWLKFFVKNYLLRKKVKQQKGIWFIDTWSDGYFHYMTDALTRLVCLKDYLKEAEVYLPERYKSYGYTELALKAFGIEKVNYIPVSKYYQFKSLTSCTPTAGTGNYNEQVLKQLGTIYREYYADCRNPIGADRVYVSRAKAAVRKVENEDQLIPILKKNGFEIVHFEDFDWEDQVRICYHAKYLVSLHGAGLTNMLFMNPGTSVLELRKKNDDFMNCYYSMACALDLEYYYFLGDAKTVDERQYFRSDVHVDLGQFEHRLTQMLEK